METFLSILQNPFTWGLLLGLLFAGLATWNFLKTRLELGRYKRMLSDKMEIESAQHRKLHEEKERLAKENENLRIKVGSTRDTPAREMERELEILARAERAMNVNAPGFAGAWESAKARALEEIQAEESGQSIPKRIYRKFFKGGTPPSSGSANTPALAESSRSKKSSNDDRNSGGSPSDRD